MSEYQSYEFVAIDHPLSAKQMAALRAISTRAEISATRFWSEYQWGDLKADPAKLVARYFDAHLHLTSWSTHRLILRLPKARVDTKALEQYFVTQHASLARVGQHVVLDVITDLDEAEYDDGQSQHSLAELSPLRAELMQGDMRPAYLAWLLAVDRLEMEDDAMEPPVPAGLAQLTLAQQAMLELLRIDVDLLTVAANASTAASKDDAPFRQWLASLSAKEKDVWLKRAADEPDLALGGELRRAFQMTVKRVSTSGRRTVGELRALAEAQRAKPKRKRAVRESKAKAASGAQRLRRRAQSAKAKA